MPGTNDFLTFAAGGGANVLTQAQYAALTSILANGFGSGTATSAQLNKVWRQSSLMSAVQGALIANVTNQNVVDDGTTATILSNLMAALMVAGYGDDSGAVNAYVVTLSPAPLAYYDGMRVGFSTVNANTTTNPTVNVNGLGAITITGKGGIALTAGQIPANTTINLTYNSTGPRFEMHADAAGFNMASAGAINFGYSTLASAATASLDIWTNQANGINYTGALGPVTGFANAPQAGATRTLVAASTPSFTAGANFTIDGVTSGNTITLAAGDKLVVRATSTTTFNARWEKADGTSVNATTAVISVRQTVLGGVTNSSGYANMLSAGSGLALNLAATAKPMRIAFAAGSVDFLSTLSADVTGVVSGLAANNLSYIKADYSSGSAVLWDKTLAPVQYGYAYNQAAQELLHFDGTAGSTTILSDYGNTWTAQGGAKLQTNQVRFGTAALGGGGTANALNGTTDYIKCAGITSLGSGSWLLRVRGYITAYAADSFNDFILNGGTGTFGVGIALAASGSNKVNWFLSSNGSSWDITNTVGTTVVSLNSYHEFALVYDAVAGKYFGYIDGAADLTVTSSSKVCALTSGIALGANTAGTSTSCLNGYLDEFEFQQYCDTPNGTTYTPAVAASSVATANYSSDFFSIPDMTMYKVTAASASAGANPTLTAVNRVYVGEAVTGGVSVSSVVNYALNGRYSSVGSPTAFAASTVYNFAHNIGVPVEFVRNKGMARSAANYPWFENSQTYNASNIFYNSATGFDRNNSKIGVGTGMYVNNSTSTIAMAQVTTGQVAIESVRSF